MKLLLLLLLVLLNLSLAYDSDSSIVDYISLDDLDDKIETEVMSSYITKAIGIVLLLLL